MITIVICYAAGTEAVLHTCLAALGRHDAGEDFQVKVYTDPAGLSEAAARCTAHQGTVEVVACPPELSGSKKHGFMLDVAMTWENGPVLTLDSDCFPVADGWLTKMTCNGAHLPGISWPWESPSPTMNKKSIEWRVRNIQNWRNTWVACQLVDMEFIRDHKLSYSTGDDTGVSIIEKANELGLCVEGLMPTRCASPAWASGFDPEMNRHVCVVYGDCMMHLGGGSSKVDGREPHLYHFFEHPIEMTLRKGSADWIMDDQFRFHRYLFDREAEVAEFKMKIMKQEIVRHLQNHDRIF